ncbi:hypothetical protein [Lelliottia amnigena]|uniref:hypothetical protein n=1 Tax=Lelliottia amnigena TaxID=61646 RepID=UPI0019576573|nr:hypothetical protein [Lelliottia amnigena]MBM7355252.1 uncharacterized protein with ParB-like and HNH nuclease domain [Lelliottia amnigena]WSO21605.1 hypothetical protein VUJ45_10780 [Lelliottia amnigena]
MKRFSVRITTLSLLLLAILICLIVTRSFVDEKYVQSNFIKYYLLTPKSLREAPRVGTSWYFTNQTVEGSGLQISTLNFTGIQSDEIRSLRDELQHYVDNYPDRNTTMSVNIGERNGMVELSITHYNSGDDK